MQQSGPLEIEFEVDGTTFFYGSLVGRSTVDRLFLCKPAGLLERYLEVLAGVKGQNVVELGIFEGGSAALAALVGEPRRLVVVDHGEPVEPLDRFISTRQLSEVIRPKYGVDQADRARLRAIVREEFGDEPLDLVIDDASHLFGPTRASFEVLFPLLRPGGRYLIEDWSWEATRAIEYRAVLRSGIEVPVEAADRLRGRPRSSIAAACLRGAIEEGEEPASGTARRFVEASGFDMAERVTPLLTLGLELVLAKATSDQAIAAVTMDDFWISVERGPASLDPDTFEVAGLYGDVVPVLDHPLV